MLTWTLISYFNSIGVNKLERQRVLKVERKTLRGEKSVNLDMNASLSIGPQIGEHISGVEGLELSIASWDIVDVNFNINYSDKGLNITRPKVTYFWEDSKVKQFASFDTPLVGVGVEHNFMTSNPYGTEQANLNIHGGFPALGVHQDYNLMSPTVDNSVGGSAGIRAVLGGDIGYKFSIK